ncbi:hypothetical protein [Flavobacterium sp. ABG]|uniref:hypothetical protein n=1 Tax=Flavobacterium sp. ABG TaxID=1423322 RepID=UPI000649981A|nr:hypothetical protein [Flavobacterium sp. ABG]KLT69907.1 hypothetical protein AB674_09385 [Flavobacterium sp. ABG]
MVNIPVTPEIRIRIEAALTETIQVLQNELKLDEKDQDPEAIQEYRDHIKKLESALETGIYNKAP